MLIAHVCRAALLILLLTPLAAAAIPPQAQNLSSPQTVATVRFRSQSVEIDGAARIELARVVKQESGKGTILLRAYANGGDPEDARKIALARGLSVRSYLIEEGLRVRIEVAAAAGDGGPGGDRVEIVDR